MTPAAGTADDPARWRLLAGAVGLYFCFGVVITSIAPMLTVVQEDLGATRAQMGVILSSWALVFIVTAPLAGRAIDRIGLRVGLTVGGLCIAISALARAAAPNTVALWFAVAVFGIGGPLISTGAPALVTTWFTSTGERRRAVSTYAAAPALGAVAVLALTNTLLLPALGGWRAVLAFEAGLAVVATIGWIVVSGHVSPRPAPAATDRRDARIATLLRSARLRAALLSAFLIFFLNHALNTWYPTLLEDLGELSPDAASAWVAASVAVGIGAALAVPRIAGGRTSSSLLAGSAVGAAAGLLIVAFGPTGVIGPAALVVGVRGALVPLSALLLMDADVVTPENAGTANGIWFAAGEVGGVSGPILVGVLAGGDPGSRTAVVALACVALALAAAVTVEGRRRGQSE